MSLCILVLLPLVTVGYLGETVSTERVDDAARGVVVQEEVRAVVHLDRVRSAVDQELLPTLLLADTDKDTEPEPDTDTDTDTALVASRTAATGRSAEALELAQARQATDQTISLIPSRSRAEDATAPASAQLRALRVEADGGTISPTRLAQSYLLLASNLALAERAMVAQATADGLTPATSRASYDLLLLTQLAQEASSELPLLVASHLTPATASAAERDAGWTAWLQGWGSFGAMTARVDDLDDAALRVRWRQALTSPAGSDLDAALAAAAADRSSPLSVHQAVALSGASARRDADLMAVVDQAVARATGLAQVDRQAAQDRSRLTTLLTVAALVLSITVALGIILTSTAALRALTVAARRISQGHRVDVPRHGPREVRSVARVLDGAAAVLHRVQQQADAVARGDLAGATLGEPMPGPLGALVQASVERVVVAVRAREELQAELSHQASHDTLTGLANRARTTVLGAARLAAAAGTPAHTALLFVDLDRFKAVNDTLGHAAGDEVLRVTAARLLRCARTGDVVGRLGGDEFVVIADGLECERDVLALADRIAAALAEPIGVGGGSVDVGASVGVAISHGGQGTVEDLLREADIAVYRAKASGRARVEVFDDGLRAELAARAEMATALGAALDSPEQAGLSLVYQPVVDLATGRVEGFEALSRWDRPDLGRVSPEVFVGVAEESDLVCALDRWVLEQACRTVLGWGEVHVSVNISGRHLVEERVVADVAAALAATGLAPHRLVLEITETVLVADPRAEVHLHQLRALGCQVSIDDFGTGYTSIGALGHMPADILKIDRSFVASDTPGDRAIVALAIAAAHTVGMVVVAEGAETHAHLEPLREARCDFVQGYVFSRPLPPAEAAALVAGTDAVTAVPGADHGKSIHAAVAAQT